MRVPLTLACRDYDRTMGLIDESIRPDGIDLIWIPLVSHHDIFVRMLKNNEFDVSEMSLASYISAKARGAPFVALPIFPSRMFRHSYIFVNTKAKISGGEDLAKKRIGVQAMTVTAVVWQKAILQHQFSVPLDSIEWFVERQERVQISYPASMNIHHLAPGKNIEAMVADGELDAVLSPRIIQPFLEGSPHVRRLFGKADEIRYFRDTGIFPIMHTVIVNNSLLAKFPWAARSLVDAFEKSKRRAYARFEDPNPEIYTLPWIRFAVEEQCAALGPDPYPYNIEDNSKALTAFTQYCAEQGLVDRKLSLDELFVQL